MQFVVCAEENARGLNRFTDYLASNARRKECIASRFSTVRASISEELRNSRLMRLLLVSLAASLLIVCAVNRGFTLRSAAALILVTGRFMVVCILLVMRIAIFPFNATLPGIARVIVSAIL